MAKVLIVDDSPLGRKLLKRILLKANHEVVAEAENGEQGVLEYIRVKPEIVTMDVDMPGINGLQASKRILEYHPEAKIIVVSAHGQNDLKDEMANYGLEFCIIKPVTDENVREAFQKALSDINIKGPEKASNNVKTDKAPEAKMPGIKVAVSHYSVIDFITTEKTGEEGKVLSLAIKKETPLKDFMEEDPVVLGYESNGEYILSLCEISSVDAVNKALNARVIHSYPLETETMYQNLPASMYIDLRLLSKIKKYPAIIKTFTINEIVFKSNVDVNTDEKVSFDIYHKGKLLSIDGRIISKTQGGKNAEYILRLVFDDYNKKKVYMTYLQDSASDLKKSITDVFTRNKP